VAKRFPIIVPKRRGNDDPWFRVGMTDIGTTAIVVALNVVAMFLYAVSPKILAKMIFAADATSKTTVTVKDVQKTVETITYTPWNAIKTGQIWRAFLWPFVTPPSIGAAFTLAMFYFAGTQLEGQFGRVRYTKFLVIIAAVIALVALALGYPIGGSRLIAIATFATFIAENPRMPFFFGIKAWIIGIVYVGIEVLQYLGNSQTRSLILLVAALAAAAVLLRGYGWGSEIPWVPKLAIPAILGGPTGKPATKTGRSKPSKSSKPTKPTKAQKRAKGSGNVVSGPWGESGTGSASPAAGDAPRLNNNGTVTQADVDRVLDKVAASGLNSLTADERSILEDASKTLRDRGNG
jgi:membrane associated rhomboid family serine protease